MAGRKKIIAVTLLCLESVMEAYYPDKLECPILEAGIQVLLARTVVVVVKSGGD